MTDTPEATIAEDAKTPLDAHRWARQANEWYVEPQWCDDVLFQNEDVPGGSVYDPFAGMGRVLDGAAKKGHFTFGSDLRDRGAQHPITIKDASALDFTALGKPTIASNPPYGRPLQKLVQLFLNELRLGTVEKVMFLLPVRFLFGAERSVWFEENPPERIWLLAPRPSMPPGDVVVKAELLGDDSEIGGGTQDFIWAVWTAENLMICERPRIQWMRRPGWTSKDIKGGV